MSFIGRVKRAYNALTGKDGMDAADHWEASCKKYVESLTPVEMEETKSFFEGMNEELKESMAPIIDAEAEQTKKRVKNAITPTIRYYKDGRKKPWSAPASLEKTKSGEFRTISFTTKEEAVAQYNKVVNPVDHMMIASAIRGELKQSPIERIPVEQVMRHQCCSAEDVDIACKTGIRYAVVKDGFVVKIKTLKDVKK